MWVLEWEQQSTGHHKVEAVSENAAQAQAHELVAQGIRQVVFYEIADEEMSA